MIISTSSFWKSVYLRTFTLSRSLSKIWKTCNLVELGKTSSASGMHLTISSKLSFYNIFYHRFTSDKLLIKSLGSLVYILCYIKVCSMSLAPISNDKHNYCTFWDIILVRVQFEKSKEELKEKAVFFLYFCEPPTVNNQWKISPKIISTK